MTDDEIERKLWEEDDSKHPRGKGQQGGQFVPKNQGQTSTKPTAKKKAPAKPAPKKPAPGPTPLDQLATKAYRNFGTFKEGDSGQEVRDIQELLNGLGLASPDGKKIYPDGKFGPATTAAIKAMQAKLGVKKPNGHMSASLMRKLQDTALLSPCAARSAVMEIAYEDFIERADTDAELDAADDLADESEVEEEPEHTGAMVALIPTAAEADRLAVEGFEPADELHVTLVYLGEAADIDADTRNAIVEGLRGLVEDAIRPDYDLPLTAEAFSVAVFNPQSEDFDACIVLGLSGSDLEEVHGLVDEAVNEAMQQDVPDQHQPWTPHITLAYTDDTSRLDELLDRTGSVEFDRIRVAFGDEVTDIPLTLVAAAVRASGVLDAGGHLHAPGGSSFGGRFITKLLGDDPLGLEPKAGHLLGPGDAFDSSARLDGRDGALLAAVTVDASGEPSAILSTVKTHAITDWDATDETNSIAWIDRETAGEIAKAFDSVMSGRSKSKDVSGVDLGDVFIRSTDSGVDVGVWAYPILPSLDADFRKDRRDERADLVREIQAPLDPEDELTPEEWARYGQEQLAEFDAETEQDLAAIRARRDAHTISFTGDQAAALRDWLRTFAKRPDVARAHTVSDRPWGDFTQADYTPEEWAHACLIHLTKDSYSKDDCKLPVREPDGTLNRNAVHSAAGRIHSVQASPDLKRQAAKALIHLYDDIGDDPPDPLVRLADDASRSDVEFWTQGAGRDRWLSSPTPAAILRTLLADHVTSAEAQQIATRCITHEFSTDRSDSG